MTYLNLTDLNTALAVRDLSDPSQGEHALSLLLRDVVSALAERWDVPTHTHRAAPLVSTRDNYDRLGYSPGAVTRDSRYSRHLSPTVMLRSHTSAGVPAVLDSLAGHTDRYDALHVLPGLVYRRDAVDRHHVGTPHQVDLWRVKSRGLLGLPELRDMMGAVAEAVLPDCTWRAVPTKHPYTVHGHQLDVWIPAPGRSHSASGKDDGEWLELAECGLIAGHVLRGSGMDPQRWCGLALGMGLDRALMLRKGIDDVRLLRSANPEVAAQMHDLQPYRPVSAMPPVTRDISIVCDPGADTETLGDAARSALEAWAAGAGDASAGLGPDVLASLDVLQVSRAEDLPGGVVNRLGMLPGQENLLLRLTLQALDRTLTAQQANVLRDVVYRAVHQGPVLELIAG